MKFFILYVVWKASVGGGISTRLVDNYRVCVQAAADLRVTEENIQSARCIVVEEKK